MTTDHELHAEIIAAFMKAPRTAEELMEYADIRRSSAYRIVKAYRAAGIIYLSGLRAPGREGGRPCQVFTLQVAPFAEPDVVK